jgi:RNA polymerase sigma factor (sigma-70 family)
MTDDAELLRQYAADHSEAAFAELVQRRLDLVYSVALRQVGGDAHLAQDVTQRVFADLARKAAQLAERAVLSGWLYRSAQFAASDVVRSERRRRAREQETDIMRETSSSVTDTVDWDRLRPLLDEAMGELNEEDRDAVALRFFEGRAFAEIGAALRLTEDAARKRVERALGKLHQLLSRRGVTSTTAALGVALTEQAGIAAPAGLAASVVTGALTPVGTGFSAGLSIFRLMSAIKLTGGVAVTALLLGISLTGNAYLLSQPTHSAEAGKGAGSPSSAPVARAAPEVPLAAFAGDVSQLRDTLVAAGVSDQVARGVVEGILRQRYREKLSALREEKMRTAWWQDRWWINAGANGGPPRFSEDKAMLREMVLDPLEKLFGPSPQDVAASEAPFEFLPPEKRTAFAALEREHQAAMARLPDGNQNSGASTALNQAYKEDLVKLRASLTSAEREEYDLHFSAEAIMLRERMNQMAASETEYRAIMAVVTAPENQSPSAFLRPDSDQPLVDRLVDAMGYDRALDYVWAGAWEYSAYARAAADANLPVGTAARVMELAAETADQALQIHRDPTLTPAEKRAAVVALQADVRPRLDALMPPVVQAQVGTQASQWFTDLGEGRYKYLPTSFSRGAGSVMGSGGNSVEGPVPAGGVSKQFVMRRPAGG